MHDPLWAMMQLEAHIDERVFARRRFRGAGDDMPGDISGRRDLAGDILAMFEAGGGGRCDIARKARAALRDRSWLVDAPRFRGALLAGDHSAPDMLVNVGSPPCLGLWTIGDAGLLDPGLVRVAIVGSRKARPESIAIARSLARAVVQAGGIVVSGLATGVDTEAHRAALEASGTTVAVLAGGVRHVYPKRNAGIVRRMLVGATESRDDRGLIVSEYGPADVLPRPYRFQERNRIIAALSDYVIVVQATRQSGSMGTARVALELGIPVGVVASSVVDPQFSGSIELLRDGADCIVDGPAVLKHLDRHGLAVVPDHDQLSAHPLATLLTVPRPVEDVADLAGLDPSDVRRMLIELEVDGLVERSASGLWTNVVRTPSGRC